MRRAAPTLPITPGMIRHFAVVTLVATVGLAMFAHGENTAAEPKAKQGQPAEGGGVMSAMFGGAEEAALKQAREATRNRNIHGMNVAAGTRLEQGGGYDPDPEIHRNEAEATGDIRNLYPELHSLPPGSVGMEAQGGPGQAAMPGVPAPIQRDPSGIPVPGLKVGAGQPAKARPQAPRQASEQDVERMLEASRARSAKGNGSNSAYSDTSVDE